ncbi:MAG TPA: hypothetical protein PKD55_26380, partial [Bellilinea sp.]|nr:hypothetical protein [Bellilinea sp.]
ADQRQVLENTATPVEIITPIPTVTLSEATASPEVAPVLHNPSFDMERAIKSARILLFEDMFASRHLRYVKEALDREDYFYQDVGSAKGWFKSLLLSPVDWDLVIAAAEARRDFGGEFFEYLDQQVERGSSVIVEYWDWDAAPNGKAQLLLERCGVSFQSDWFEPDMRVFFWLSPEQPIFNEPNLIPGNLGNAAALWSGDVGDLFRLDEVDSSAVLLAGTNPQFRNDHAILVSCMDGRVILQGFSSHEYAKENVIALWQNYVYQALKNRFIYKPPYQQPVVTPVPDDMASTPSQISHIGEQAACGDHLIAVVSDAPLRQVDLFEHHAKGEYLLVNLELENRGPTPQQIYDQDYFLEGILDGNVVVYQLDKAATGYLYIQNAGNLYQDLIMPGVRWRTNLAFDIAPRISDLILIVKPGAEFQHQACEVRISLELDYTQE